MLEERTEPLAPQSQDAKTWDAAVIGAGEAANLMSVVIENEGSRFSVFLIFAIGFVILTLPLGLLFTSMSRRLAVKR